MNACVLIIDAESTPEMRLAAAEVYLGARESGSNVRMRAIADLFPTEFDHYVLAGLDHVVPPLLEAVTYDDLAWAHGVAFGVDGFDGNVPASLKAFLEGTVALWRSGELAEKLVCAFGSSPPTRSEAAFALLQTACHWGSVFVPGGAGPGSDGGRRAARKVGRRLGELANRRESHRGLLVS
jgi:NAD(P)H dehydrogenase (quinone)